MEFSNGFSLLASAKKLTSWTSKNCKFSLLYLKNERVVQTDNEAKLNTHKEITSQSNTFSFFSVLLGSLDVFVYLVLRLESLVTTEHIKHNT